MGLKSIPCIRVDHLDETEQRLLRLAVNRLGEKGSWDPDELEVEFKELIIADAPIEISGLGADEVEHLIDEVSENGQEAVDAVATAGSSIARPADLFRLGVHRLICGDASDPAVIRRLMANDAARFVFTHEPFEVVFGGEVTGCKSGQMTEAQFLDFNRKWLDAVLPYLVDGGVLGIFIDWRGLPIVHASATALGFDAPRPGGLGKSTRGSGQSLPSPARLAPAFQEGLLLPRQQPFRWQARPPSHQRVDRSRCPFDWIKRAERSF